MASSPGNLLVTAMSAQAFSERPCVQHGHFQHDLTRLGNVKLRQDVRPFHLNIARQSNGSGPDHVKIAPTRLSSHTTPSHDPYQPPTLALNPQYLVAFHSTEQFPPSMITSARPSRAAGPKSNFDHPSAQQRRPPHRSHQDLNY